jgi:uncharacterized membrane protein
MKPIHPMLVHFPIALLLMSVTADFAAFFTDMRTLRDTAWWSLLGAAVSGLFTVLAGLYDMRRAQLKEEVHARVHRHMKVGLTLLTALVGLTLWRWTIHTNLDLTVGWSYLAAALLVVCLTGLQGWLGGELVYSDGVFVRHARGGRSPEGTHKKHLMGK